MMLLLRVTGARSRLAPSKRGPEIDRFSSTTPGHENVVDDDVVGLRSVGGDVGLEADAGA